MPSCTPSAVASQEALLVCHSIAINGWRESSILISDSPRHQYNLVCNRWVVGSTGAGPRAGTSSGGIWRAFLFFRADRSCYYDNDSSSGIMHMEVGWDYTLSYFITQRMYVFCPFLSFTFLVSLNTRGTVSLPVRSGHWFNHDDHLNRTCSNKFSFSSTLDRFYLPAVFPCFVLGPWARPLRRLCWPSLDWT